jgi:sRNA-binding protein
MSFWCNQPHYLIAIMAPGAKRHGLDGTQDEISEEAAKDAKQRLEELKARQKEIGRKIRQAEKERQAAIKKAAEKAAAAEIKAKPPEPTPPPTEPKTTLDPTTKQAGPLVTIKKRRAMPLPRTPAQ